LVHRQEYLRLRENPFVYKTATIWIFWKPNEKPKHIRPESLHDVKATESTINVTKHSVARLGITIKGRILSVWRKRIKRVIREWFRLTKENYNGIDLNVVVRLPQILNWNFIDDLKNELNEWKKARNKG